MTELSTITLVEFQTRSLTYSELPEEEANRIHIQFSKNVTVEWPTPITQQQWKLTSKGWVG